jgi:hypothetical protein
MFSEGILSGVSSLREKYRGRRSCILANFPIIEIVKYMQQREISIKLFYTAATDTLEMQPPDQKYYSRISHYDFRKPERRWIRDKGFMFALIKDLKLCGLWNHVSNKDVIIVNTYNSRTDAATLMKALEELTDESCITGGAATKK